MAALLTETWLTVLEAKAADKNALTSVQPEAVRSKYDAIIAAGHVANPPIAQTRTRGRPKRTKSHNLMLRLDNYADDVLRFATDFTVPFDPNLSERDVRMVKIAQKVSGGFRSKEGAKVFLAFRSYLSTAAKQSVNRLEALRQLFNDEPWMLNAPGAGP